MAVDVTLDLPGGDPARVLQHAPDEALVELVRGGSSAAFETLYDRHHRGLLTFCRHLLWSREEAEDALQVTFASAYRALTGDGERPSAVKPWLYTIARNRCLTMLRARRTRREADDEPAESTSVAEGLTDEVQRRSDLRDLLADLHRLPDDQRAALVLFEMGDHSHAEIASVLSVNREKVKALVFQAREGLLRARTARDTPCAEIRRHLSSRTRALPRRGVVRGHLDRCAACAAYDLEIRRQRAALAIALPVVPSLELKGSILGPMLGGGATIASGSAVIAGGAGAGGAGIGSSGAVAAAGAGAVGGGAAGVGAGSAAIATGTAAASGAGALAAKAMVAKALTVVAVASAAVGTGGNAAPALHDAAKAPAAALTAPLHNPGPIATRPIDLPAAASMPAGPALTPVIVPAAGTTGAIAAPAAASTTTAPATTATTAAAGTGTTATVPATPAAGPATTPSGGAAPAATTALPAEPTMDPTTGGTTAPPSITPDAAPAPTDPPATSTEPAVTSTDPTPGTTVPAAGAATTDAPRDTTAPGDTSPADTTVGALSADPLADPCATAPADPANPAATTAPDPAAIEAAAAAVAAQSEAAGGAGAQGTTPAGTPPAAATCAAPAGSSSDLPPADPPAPSASTP